MLVLVKSRCGPTSKWNKPSTECPALFVCAFPSKDGKLTFSLSFSIVTAFTIEPSRNQGVDEPIEGIMTTYGYCLPYPTGNRFSIWFTGGSIEVGGGDIDRWHHVFHKDALPRRSLSEIGKRLAAKLLMGTETSRDMDENGKISYRHTRPIPANIDLVYMDSATRIMRASSGNVYVASRVQNVEDISDDDSDDSVPSCSSSLRRKVERTASADRWTASESSSVQRSPPDKVESSSGLAPSSLKRPVRSQSPERNQGRGGPSALPTKPVRRLSSTSEPGGPSSPVRSGPRRALSEFQGLRKPARAPSPCSSPFSSPTSVSSLSEFQGPRKPARAASPCSSPVASRSISGLRKPARAPSPCTSPTSRLSFSADSLGLRKPVRAQSPRSSPTAKSSHKSISSYFRLRKPVRTQSPCSSPTAKLSVASDGHSLRMPVRTQSPSSSSASNASHRRAAADCHCPRKPVREQSPSSETRKQHRRECSIETAADYHLRRVVDGRIFAVCSFPDLDLERSQTGPQVDLLKLFHEAELDTSERSVGSSKRFNAVPASA